MEALKRLFRHEAAGGLVLVVAAIAAMIASNAQNFAPLYDQFLDTMVQVSAGDWALKKPLILWINDGLMAVFFFLVGLEIKREFLEGHLSSMDQVVLPALAALGGMVAPAIIYTSVVTASGDHHLIRGWAIPAATDIAFALGALALVGSRAPSSLKVFLLTLATLDDLGAILIIAFFYTDHLSAVSLGLAIIALLVLWLMNRWTVYRIAPYILVGIFLWVCVLKSGVHATLAGVALAFAIPLKGKRGGPLLEDLEHGLAPYVKWFILPLFAFANAGVPLDGIGPSSMVAPLPLAIALGLFLGKPIGILAMTFLAKRFGWARLPDGCSWMHMVGIGFLAGIGFTMSLFIGMLAFSLEEDLVGVRIGVIVGSIVSAVVGYLVLARFAPASEEPAEVRHAAKAASH
ncbi:MAG: Na+/H+ antiporter NhaA [Hyphomicrobiales bacterium]